MTFQIRIPGEVDVPTKFFGHFTVKDLIRLAAPPGAVYLLGTPSTLSVTTVGAVIAALAVSLTLYLYTPYGTHLDTHAVNAVRWYLGKRGTDSDIDDTEVGYVTTSDGGLVSIFEVSPTNLEMKTQPEQAALHSVYRELFETVDFPVTVHSRQRSLDLSEYHSGISGIDTGYDELRESYLEYIDELDGGTGHFATDHYIVVRVDPSGSDTAQNYIGRLIPDRLSTSGSDSDDERDATVDELQSRCRKVRQAINTADVTLDGLAGEELQSVAESVDQSELGASPKWTDHPDEEEHREFRKTVYVTEFPGQLELGWPAELLRVNGKVDVTQVVRPRDPGEVSQKLSRLSEKLHAEINSFLSQGYQGTNKLQALLDDVEWMQDLLAGRDDIPVDYGVYITAHAETKQDCRRCFDSVCTRLSTMQIGYQQPVFQTRKAHAAESPVRRDRLEEHQLMPGRSAAAGFPFVTQETERTTGVIYGVDAGDSTPVLLDRWSWASHSMARMGMTGSGKSYAAKTELLRAVLSYDELQVHIVDPKQEYGEITRRLNGEVYTLGEDDLRYDAADISCYQVGERGVDNVSKLADVIRDLYREVSQDQRRTLVIIDEARILMNDEDGRRVLNQFVLEGRDTNTALTLISQNASHFTFCREGREILDNMPAKVFMRHERVPDSVVDYFDLSQQEKQKLFELKTGTDSEYSEALLKVSNRLDTKIRINATDDEDGVIQTDAHQEKEVEA